jgi:hypothetical protein
MRFCFLLFALVLAGCTPARVPVTRPVQQHVEALSSGVRAVGVGAARTTRAIERAQAQQTVVFKAAPADLRPLVQTLGNDLAAAKSEAATLQSQVGNLTTTATAAESAVQALQRDIDAREQAHAAELAAEKAETARVQVAADRAAEKDRRKIAAAQKAQGEAEEERDKVEARYHRLKWPACAAGGLLMAWLTWSVFKVIPEIVRKRFPSIAGYRLIATLSAGGVTTTALMFLL